MMISDSEFELIVACLRHCAMHYEDLTRATLDNHKARGYVEFSKACGDLSNRLDNERRPRGLLLPTIKRH